MSTFCGAAVTVSFSQALSIAKQNIRKNGVGGRSRCAILAWGRGEGAECCGIGHADPEIGHAEIVIACESIDYALDVTHR